MRNLFSGMSEALVMVTLLVAASIEAVGYIRFKWTRMKTDVKPHSSNHN